jgi:hypothetical protein
MRMWDNPSSLGGFLMAAKTGSRVEDGGRKKGSLVGGGSQRTRERPTVTLVQGDGVRLFAVLNSLAQCCEPSRAAIAVSEHDLVGSQCRTEVASNMMLLHLRKQLQVEAGR